jgi:hypothetical protein
MAVRLPQKGKDVKIEVRVLITKEEGAYNATCLEMGLAAAGPDLDTVRSDMAELIVAQLRACQEEGRLGDAFVPAPPEYWRIYVESVLGKSCQMKKMDLLAQPGPATQSLLSDLDVRSYVCAVP